MTPLSVVLPAPVTVKREPPLTTALLTINGLTVVLVKLVAPANVRPEPLKLMVALAPVVTVLVRARPAARPMALPVRLKSPAAEVSFRVKLRLVRPARSLVEAKPLALKKS